MGNLDNTIFSIESHSMEPHLDKSIVITVFRVTVRKLEISWTELPAKYFRFPNSKAILEYSDSPTGGWEELCTIDRYHVPYFVDENTVVTYYRSPMAYYRIRFPEANAISRVFSNEKEPNLYGAEISRRHSILLKEGHAGNLMYLFTRMKFRENCPECWDDLRGTRSKAYCPVCLGTGFVGGYYSPAPIYVSVSPEQNTIQQSPDGVVITGSIQCWTSGFPRLQMGDIIVDPSTQDIYHVDQVQLTTHKRVVTKQEFTMSHQDEDMAIFKLLERVPRNPDKKDMRHGENIY